jgi:hypothetical protein
MSHLVKIPTQIRDQAAVAAACERLGLPASVHGTAQLYGGAVTGLLVQLPGWLYPLVIDTATGNVQFDNFNGRWGDQAQFDSFLQRYAVEVARLEARKQGHTFTEQATQGGSIKVQIIEA